TLGRGAAGSDGRGGFGGFGRGLDGGGSGLGLGRCLDFGGSLDVGRGFRRGFGLGGRRFGFGLGRSGFSRGLGSRRLGSLGRRGGLFALGGLVLVVSHDQNSNPPSRAASASALT